MAAVLKDFGKSGRREEPGPHSYETSGGIRPRASGVEGVYATREPAASRFVRSVDHLPREEFGLPEGLAGASSVGLEQDAAGSGTFLHAGGFRVREKWLKDRKGRTSNFDELEQYRAVAGSAAETAELMGKIDRDIEKRERWPIAG